jgi:hypothetical protein
MTNPKPQELFDALERGERVEVWDTFNWVRWNGKAWDASAKYQIIKPKKTVVLYKWLCREGNYLWLTELQTAEPITSHIVRRLDETRTEIEVEE